LAESAPIELSLLGSEPGCLAVYGWQNLSFVVWLGPANIESVARLDQISLALRERYPQGVSGVHIVVSGQTQLPTAEARAALVRMTNDYGTWLCAIAVVIRGGGFWASAMRSVVTAMRVLGSRAFEMRIHGSIEEVVEWLPERHFKRTGVQITRVELLQVLRQVERVDGNETTALRGSV
jgi:hypothetical protein